VGRETAVGIDFLRWEAENDSLDLSIGQAEQRPKEQPSVCHCSLDVGVRRNDQEHRRFGRHGGGVEGNGLRCQAGRARTRFVEPGASCRGLEERSKRERRRRANHGLELR